MDWDSWPFGFWANPFLENQPPYSGTGIGYWTTEFSGYSGCKWKVRWLIPGENPELDTSWRFFIVTLYQWFAGGFHLYNITTDVGFTLEATPLWAGNQTDCAAWDRLAVLGAWISPTLDPEPVLFYLTSLPQSGISP